MKRFFLLAALLTSCATPTLITQGAPLPVRHEGRGRGDLSEEDILTVMLQAKPALQNCSRQEQARSNGRGTVFLVFEILPSGEVTDIAVRDRETASYEISRCIAAVVSGLRFRPSTRGESVTFPFKF